MRDRQYARSLALTVAVVLVSLCGLTAVPVWLGWAGVAALGTTAGGLLVWFYWGSRPDLRPGGSQVNAKRRDDG